MEDFFKAVFGSGPPTLGLGPRPGTLDAESVRKAVASHAGPSSKDAVPDRIRLLEGLALLWHDHWHAAHEVAQVREGERDFDLLHAILHRREGDYANSEYWFRRAGKHPCYPILERRLAPLPGARAVLAPDGKWSPSIFVARVRKEASSAGADAAFLALVQAEEFRAFSEWLLAY